MISSREPRIHALQGPPGTATDLDFRPMCKQRSWSGRRGRPIVDLRGGTEWRVGVDATREM